MWGKKTRVRGIAVDMKLDIAATVGKMLNGTHYI
jgi:hypothetical protein